MYLGVARWNHEDQTVTYHWNADSQGDVSAENWLRFKLNVDEATPDFPDEAPVDLRRYIRINGQVLTGCLKNCPFMENQLPFPESQNIICRFASMWCKN